MSKASKARRASYRRQERECARMGWSWSLREAGERQLVPERDDLEQAHIMHKVSPNAQHMSAVQSFSCFRAGDRAYMLGEAGLPLPADMLSGYYSNMHKAGAKAAAAKRAMLHRNEIAALERAQQAQLDELCRANGILPCESNRELMQEVLDAEKRKSQAVH